MPTCLKGLGSAIGTAACLFLQLASALGERAGLPCTDTSLRTMYLPPKLCIAALQSLMHQQVATMRTSAS